MFSLIRGLVNYYPVKPLILLLAAIFPFSGSLAASCGNSAAGFDGWLDDFKAQAVAQGISQGAVSSALNGISYDRKVVQLDRSQRSFKLSFEKFYARRVSNAMIRKGQRYIQQHRSMFDRIEARYGVPSAIVVSIWALETNFGGNSGKMNIVRSLATLAYDCRRSDFFKNELLAALRIVDRGDMSPGQLRGGWAGEIGQTQFLASSYVKFAVDFDGNGRRDLIRSVPDVLASTANFLKAHGWQRGGGWQPGSANYGVLNDWNRATVYQKTIAVMASKIAGNS